MAYGNLVETAYLVQGAGNQALPNAVNLSPTTRGAVVANGSNIAVQTIPSDPGPYNLVTNNQTGTNVLAWACRKPRFLRGVVGSGTASTFPSFSSNPPFYPVIDDQVVGTNMLNTLTVDPLQAGVIEYGDQGFSAVVTGQKLFWSRLMVSGANTTFVASNQVVIMGWSSAKDLYANNVGSNWYAPTTPYLSYWYPGANNTTMQHRCNGVNTSVTTTGTIPADMNGIIVSAGWDTAASSTQVTSVWFHDAATLTQIATASFTISVTGMTTSTRIVPSFLLGGCNSAFSLPTFKTQVLTSNYPSISGYTYFYAR